ncbi:MAG: DUF2795 domain-containing protein [Actinomycetota bacterium]|nr:DUF2795 domain-containing protein [Actinomycetota bacterium]
MERGSDKHAPRLDEGLKHDTQSIVQGSPVESRAEESREQEGPGEADPTPDARLVGGLRPSNGEAPTDDELEARSDLARHLDPSVFPADRDALRASAERNHAPDWVLDALRALPPDDTFPNTEAVWLALGGSRERRP